MKDKRYEIITHKLGCEPCNYKTEHDTTENDTIRNPLSCLSIEELQYLQDNNFFRNKKS